MQFPSKKTSTVPPGETHVNLLLDVLIGNRVILLLNADVVVVLHRGNLPHRHLMHHLPGLYAPFRAAYSHTLSGLFSLVGVGFYENRLFVIITNLSIKLHKQN